MNADFWIAGAALVLTLYGIYTTNRHNRLSVTPHIVGSRTKDKSDAGLVFAYDVCNHGIGPAKITKTTYFLDGKEFVAPKGSEPVEALFAARVGGKLDYTLRKHSSSGVGYSILPGQSSRLVEIFVSRAKYPDEKSVEVVFDGLDLRLEYESFYGTRYVFDTRV